MKGHWYVEENNPGEWLICWVKPDGDGGYDYYWLGESFDLDDCDTAAEKRWVRWHDLAVKLVKEAGLVHGEGAKLEFGSKSRAERALRIVKACKKLAEENVPWPEWALQAQAAGWKPPKGWKP